MYRNMKEVQPPNELYDGTRKLSATVHSLPGEDIQAYLKHHLYVVNDGGKRYGSVLVDLTHGKVVEFSLNGEA